MPNDTKEIKEDLQEKLDFLGLDLNNIPEFLKKPVDLDFRTSRGYDDNSYKVYRYLNVEDIKILITPTNRLDALGEKYGLSSFISSYLIPKKEEDIIKHATFLNMLKSVNIDEINFIEQEQKELCENIPFKVKFKENYLWQIYYSETSNMYFMLVPTEDYEYASFFYLLKKQLEYHRTGESSKIFVPICHEEYSGKYLKRSELKSIENYLWLFTEDWPLVYEVYDKEGNLSIQIVGETVVYEKVRSYYKIVLKEKEDAIKFFKLIKALFILQTELHDNYKFKVKIDANGGLEFWYNSKKLEYTDLSSFIECEFWKVNKNNENIQKENKLLKEKLDKLKEEVSKKNIEYIEKEKQISLYLECRKTFIGRVKYFFKLGKKKLTKIKEIKVEEENIKEPEVETPEIDVKKEFYTIEDLIKISQKFDKNLDIEKKLKLDILALENKNEIMESKIKNAKIYIKEIENHKNSIFEFWKFTNKDQALGLNAGNIKEKEENQIKLDKVFDYEEDFEDIGKIVDRMQQKSITKEQADSIFIATNSIEILNILKEYKDVKDISKEDKERLIIYLETLQKEAIEERELFLKEDFDIFGGMSEDKTKIKLLSGKKHREIAKSKFKVLDITKNTNIEDLQNKLISILNNINIAIKEAKSPINMSIYSIYNKNSNFQSFKIFNINPENTINEMQDNKKIEIIRINLKKGMPAVFFSNIIYYDNYNKTLPVGMDISDKVLIDEDKFEFKLINKQDFRINEDVDEINSNIKDIKVYEYNLEEKGKDDDK